MKSIKELQKDLRSTTDSKERKQICRLIQSQLDHRAEVEGPKELKKRNEEVTRKNREDLELVTEWVRKNIGGQK